MDGLYPKYTVIDNRTGSEVFDCFVLKPTTDYAAKQALLYYASICKKDELKRDIYLWLCEGSCYCQTCKKILDLSEIDRCMNAPNEIIDCYLKCRSEVARLSDID